MFFERRAADWKLDAPDWTGRLRVVAKGKNMHIKLEDKLSGEPFIVLICIPNWCIIIFTYPAKLAANSKILLFNFPKQ